MKLRVESPVTHNHRRGNTCKYRPTRSDKKLWTHVSKEESDQFLRLPIKSFSLLRVYSTCSAREHERKEHSRQKTQRKAECSRMKATRMTLGFYLATQHCGHEDELNSICAIWSPFLHRERAHWFCFQTNYYVKHEKASKRKNLVCIEHYVGSKAKTLCIDRSRCE